MSKKHEEPYLSKLTIIDSAFNAEDLSLIKHTRGKHTQLGLAYFLAYVKTLNDFPKQNPLEVHSDILTYAAHQLGFQHYEMLIFQYSSSTRQMIRHQELIKNHLGLSTFRLEQSSILEEHLYDEAFRSDLITELLQKARQFLKEQRVLNPAESVLLRLCAKVKEKAQRYIFEKILTQLSENQKQCLDQLLEVDPKTRVSHLHTLKQPPLSPSKAAILAIERKLQLIEKTNVADVDLSWLKSNYQYRLTKHIKKSSVDRIKQLAISQRYSALVCFLQHLFNESIDQLFETFSRVLTKLESSSSKKCDQDILKERKYLIRDSQKTLSLISKAVLDSNITDAELRSAIFNRIGRETLLAHAQKAEEWLSQKDIGLFHKIMGRYNAIRQYSPIVIKWLTFNTEENDNGRVLQAVEVLNELNQSNKRALPLNAPLDFVPKKLKSTVLVDGKLDKKAWECALLFKVRDEVKQGNLFIHDSKRYGRFADFFISDAAWSSMREFFFKKANLPSNPTKARRWISERMDFAYERFLKEFERNTYANIINGAWALSVDEGEALSMQEQQCKKELEDFIAKRIKTIKLPDLLIDVDNRLNFTEAFTARGRKGSSVDDICTIIATIMAQGCFIGAYSMSKLTNIRYDAIKQVSDWQMTEDAQRKALAILANAISNIGITEAFGNKNRSSSDGQRFNYRRKNLNRNFSVKFNDYALEFYTFLASNYAPYYSLAKNVTDRDSSFLLKGVLGHMSDLEIEAHSTDTWGYTEINFGAFKMLGKKLEPRIRNLKDQRLYYTNSHFDYDIMSDMLQIGSKKRLIDLDSIEAEWDQMGKFYASVEQGHADIANAMKRFVAFNQKNPHYRAQLNFGRFAKTEFILQYLSSTQLRKEIRRSLLKVELLHDLARDLVLGRRARINARDFEEQQNTCSCMTLIIACIIYWQAFEINQIIEDADGQLSEAHLKMLEHISPIQWGNLILGGEYIFNRALVKIEKSAG